MHACMCSYSFLKHTSIFCLPAVKKVKCQVVNSYSYCDMYSHFNPTHSWLWSPTPSSQWLPTVSHQHNRRFSGGVPVWPRVCPRGRNDNSVWEGWSVDPQPRRCHLQPQTHTDTHTDIYTTINTHSALYTNRTWWESANYILYHNHDN